MMVSAAYFILYFLVFAALLLLLLLNRRRYTSHTQNLPRISILIAARNEEHNILTCLQSIAALDYPTDKIEVLIGDDASTDRTKAIVNEFIRERSGYTCVPITNMLGQAKGKANVLAHLARKATSDIFLFTDADIEVPPSWAKAMLSGLGENVGVVTGLTTVKGNRLFDKMQRMDWLFSIGLMQVFSDLNMPVTTMGNNMLLTREAYEAVGGFESIPFSVTEDIAIFNQILKRGYGFRNLYDSKVLAWSAPAPSYGALLEQRKRWMRGSVYMPQYMFALFVLHSAYYPVLIPFFFKASLGVALSIALVKLLLQSVFMHICLERLHHKAPWWQYVIFELYLLVTTFILILYFFVPTKVKWKGRRY
ncbi:glycosyltransferase [Pontibacter ramchanderi]|uniref:Cellulose synthase/poly-beta-1,6-N-acetylglucosamine synthase-like glycosyltransferase n=1 Tax=Pontibacter ramchanderi TaxID=1179743 RepID=A0A2N3V2F7_9BACT|nr:glycosyltransferase [Pontibacter ramchanderi]PKV75824.1 cellulose synthase/poly-beta-1,6-N-acetylglucosamine synthase-like glycosyltransferase [Pontibacter ramchanderi]